jgi:hypothetical protein
LSDRDRPKKSWREIDARRDGAGRGAAPSPREASADAKASRAHRAALDALFEKGELGRYAEKLGLGAPKASEPARAAPAAGPAEPRPEPPKPSAASAKEQERVALRKKILEGTSREAVGRAFDRYVKAHGMPKDWELLERGLEHPRDERLAEVLVELEALLARERPRRTRTLDGRLRLIAETHDDAELRGRAQALRNRLS